MNCLMCGSKEKDILTKICSNMKVMGKSFPDGETFVVSCKKCAFTYVELPATQEDFNNYYCSECSQAINYIEAYGKEAAHEYFETVIKICEKVIDKESMILDIGGGNGEFGQFLKESGFKNVFVSDVTQRWVDEINNKGLKGILSDTMGFDDSLDGKFDLITIGNTLEHFVTFDKALLAIKKILKPNGHIYIECPDAAKYCECTVPYTMFTYEHLFHLSQTTFENIANVFGFELIELGELVKTRRTPCLFGLYKNSKNFSEPKYDELTKESILKYIKYSKEQLKPIIQTFENSQEKLILWGIGASTALLLNDTFDNCNVLQLIDRNPARQNIEYKFGGKKFLIQDPSTIQNDEATIVVMPYWYKDSIIKQIKEMGFKNKVEALSTKQPEEKQLTK